MQKLGLLFGCGVYLDTTSDHIGEKAKGVLSKVFSEYYHTKSDKELEDEVTAVLGKRPYEAD